MEIGGRKATLSLNNSGHSPMVGDILAGHGARAHFHPTGMTKKTLIVLGEALLAGVVTLLLVGVLVGVLYSLLRPCGVDGRGLWAGHRHRTVGGVVRYFKTTRRLLSKLSGGRLFQ